MAYSTIKQKKCKGNCGRYPTLGMNGYCYKCAPEEIKEKFADKKKVAQRKANERTRIRSLNQLEGNKEMVEANKGEKIIILGIDDWYKMVADVIDKRAYCWNCGLSISKSDYRNSSAHILFKSLFPSVATHPLNFIVAGNRCGCHNLTHRLDTFSEMSIFPMAVKRFYEFEPFITEHHKILNTFKEYANQL